MTRILGVDPGITGACGLIESSGKYIDCFDMPTVLQNKSSTRRMVNQYELAKLLRVVVMDAPDSLIAVVENVHSMPEQGVSGAFAFGQSFGIILGVLGALGVSIELVSPQRWKGFYELRGGEKDAARTLAQRMWPSAPLGLKKHHGRGEALLMAKWYADRERRASATASEAEQRTAGAVASGQPF